MSTSHKAYIQSEKGGELVVHEIQTSKPTSGQILIHVLATPILSYTSAVLDGSLGFSLAYPLTPGISAVGRIISTGPDATIITPHQLVFVSPAIRARDNPTAGVQVLHGWFGGATEASNRLMAEGWRHGSWAETMIAPTENVVLLDESRLVGDLRYKIEDLCWINELLVPYGGWLAAGLEVGMTVIVAPATGHFGSCAVRLALALGARRVVAAGRSAKSLESVAKLGSSGSVVPVVLTGIVENDSVALRAATPGSIGADIYLDFSPFQAFQAAGSTHPKACVSALKFGGTAVLMGGVRDDVSFNYAELMTRNITVKGNFMYRADAAVKFVQLLEGGLMSLDALTSTVFGFGDLVKAIEHAGSHGEANQLTVLCPGKK